MKREIPLIGLVLVLALLLIIPIFQVISTHAFVCNISTVLSNVRGCYVYISAFNQGFFITEKNIVGSLNVYEQFLYNKYTCTHYCPPSPLIYYTCGYTRITSVLQVCGYVLVSGKLANNYIKPLSYTGYCFILSAYGKVAFFCLSTPPKSLYYLGKPGSGHYISCFYLISYFFLDTDWQVMPSFIGFRVPLDDIFYYILCPMLFCGSTIIKSKYTLSAHTYPGYTKCRLCCVAIQRLWGKAWWGGYWICPVCWHPLTVTYLTYIGSLGKTTFTGTFCLIGTFLSLIPTKTTSCYFVISPLFISFCCSLYPVGTRATFAIITQTACFRQFPWWGGQMLTLYCKVCRTTTILTVCGGVLINYLPYCTEYIFDYKLYYSW